MSRRLKMIGLFGRISSILWGSFAKETYNFKEPTSGSHPIVICLYRGRRTYVNAYVRAHWLCRGVSVFVCTRVYVHRWTHMCVCNMLHVRTCICVRNILRVLSALPHTATHCKTLQDTARHCTTLHHTTPDCIRLHQTAPDCTRLQHSPADCNKLQQTTTHCNTLQHTATHYTTHMTSPHPRTHPPPLIPAQPVDKESAQHLVAHCAYS